MSIDRVRAAYAAIDRADRPEVWITIRPEEDVAQELQGASGPLAGSSWP